MTAVKFYDDKHAALLRRMDFSTLDLSLFIAQSLV